MTHVVALSGGKDSTALALRMAEVWPALDVTYYCSPTGDELPEMQAHWCHLEELLGQPIVKVTGTTLSELIVMFKMLPNGRARWCTRMLKIQPCLAYLHGLTDPVLYVGLRADEPMRAGIYSEDVTSRYPLREWGWGVGDVRRYLARRGVAIPVRTDCARCYAQRLGEWYSLWRDYPDIWASAVEQERWVSEQRGKEHTLRSPSRDTWPASLALLEVEFRGGRIPRGWSSQQSLWTGMTSPGACRVCTL